MRFGWRNLHLHDLVEGLTRHGYLFSTYEAVVDFALIINEWKLYKPVPLPHSALISAVCLCSRSELGICFLSLRDFYRGLVKYCIQYKQPSRRMK